MNLRVHFHPFSSFCQKVLVALYERDVPFAPVVVSLNEPDELAALEALWPMAKFPVLRDDGADRTIAEASLIVEYLDRVGGAPPLVPQGADAALATRLWDRVFDNYVEIPLQKAVSDCFRPAEKRDPRGVEEAKALLVRAYQLLERELEGSGRDWIAGEAFTLADCGAAPALFYAAMVVPFSNHPALAAYYRRLRARPSFAPRRRRGPALPRILSAALAGSARLIQ